ncbi:MAG: hypothetical protein KDD47_22275 [Acidobacteria bacterium]|nr:hypothetical protein [Acidobacteriota bacterium]
MTDPELAVSRLYTAFELFEAGVRMMRQNLRRRYPVAGDEEVEERLNAWLSDRPGARYGDAEGVPGKWPRRKTRSNGS